MEFFFGTTGSGVHPHTDPVCQWIFSGQVSGRKSWRLALPYSINLLEQANPGYKFRANDGSQLLALMMNRQPIFEFTMNPGELIFFPPGLIHTTRVESEECSTSLSLQFASPNPVEYLKTFQAYLISDIIGASKCFLDQFNAWLFGEQLPNQEGTAEANALFAEAEFTSIDTDGDGFLSKAEVTDHFQELSERLMEGSGGGLVTEKRSLILPLDVESFIHVHDVDHDGKVSAAEFKDTVMKHWTPQMARVTTLWAAPRPVAYFFQADADGNDYVTKAEFQKAFPGRPWAEVLEYDDNGDGKLFQGEFETHLKALYKVFTGRDLPADDPDNEEDDNDFEVGLQKHVQNPPPPPLTEEVAQDQEEQDEEEQEQQQSQLPQRQEQTETSLNALKLGFDEDQVRILWGIDKALGMLPAQVHRVAHISKEEFLAHFGLQGTPLIVSNGLPAEAATRKWTCEMFKKNHPDDALQRCAFPDGECDWQSLADADPSSGSAFWEYQALGESTVLGESTPERDPALVAQYQKAATIPSFIPDSPVNRFLAADSLSLMFGTQGGSSEAFTDMNCFSSVFTQLSGSTLWKLSIPYNVKTLQEENGGYVFAPPDGLALIPRMIQEHPVYQFELKEGEMLVVPPGLFKWAASFFFPLPFTDPFFQGIFLLSPLAVPF